MPSARASACAARPGQRADAAARHRLQRGGAHQVHAVAESAGLCGAQKIRHDRRPAWAWAATRSKKKCRTWWRRRSSLLDRLEIPRSIAELGISKEEFERAMPDLAKIAFDDPSWRSNPRMPLVSELVELFWSAYRGRGAAEVTTEKKQDHRVEEEVQV